MALADYGCLRISLKDLKTFLNAFSAVLSTEGRVVGLCWDKLKPKDLKGVADRPAGVQTQWISYLCIDIIAM